MTIDLTTGSVPAVTAEQMVEVDRIMVEELGIDLVRMMENAGRNLAHLARDRFLGGDPRTRQVVVLAGSGGNGGGALVCGRRLHTWGAQVRVFTTRSADRISPVAQQQLAILRQLNIPIALGVDGKEHVAVDLVVDGMIGYRLSGPPRGVAADLIRWANEQAAPILALDVPSGLDASTGRAYTPCIRAAATLTLALPKRGLRVQEGERYAGELYVGDISVPSTVYHRLGIEVEALFARAEIIRLR